MISPALVATYRALVPGRRPCVKQLTSRATYTRVLSMIHRRAGQGADEIQRLDMPLAEGSEENCGHALITFATESMADDMIKKRSGYPYDGHTLEAKHTEEGVSDYALTLFPK